MAISDYSSLKSTISSYLARTDLDAIIPTLIQLGELRLQRDLRIRPLLQVANAVMTAGDPKVGLPSDFLQMRSMHLETMPVQNLTYMSPNALYRDTPVKVSARPKFYTVLANEFQFSPIPDSAYTVQMLYYAKPAFLSESNTSNVWIANTPDALLYASLGEAEPYLMNDARLQTWAALYQRAVESISAADEGSEYGGAPMAMQLG